MQKLLGVGDIVLTLAPTLGRIHARSPSDFYRVLPGQVFGPARAPYPRIGLGLAFPVGNQGIARTLREGCTSLG